MVKYNVGDYVKVRGLHLPKVDPDKLFIVQITQARAFSHTIEVSASWLEGHLGVTNDGNKDKWYIHEELIVEVCRFKYNYIEEV